MHIKSYCGQKKQDEDLATYILCQTSLKYKLYPYIARYTWHTSHQSVNVANDVIMNLKHKLQKNKNVSLLISELLSFSIKLLALATKLLSIKLLNY